MPVAWFVGVPWVSGGRDPATGLDCWGLVICAAKACFALQLPDYHGYTDAEALEQTAQLFANRDQWQKIPEGAEQPGDVVVLKLAGTPGHAGLLVGYGLMLHTMAGREACLERYRGRAWAQRVEGFYRWLPR
jgi:cell wall-associated NlpC family hydrolase